MSRAIELRAAAALLAALLWVAACAAVPTPSLLGAADQDFLIAAVAATIFDARSAALALDRATDPQTRDYAERLADSSNDVGHRLDDLAATKHAPQAIDMTPDRRRAFATMQEAEPFDPTFVQQQKIATSGAIDLYQAEATSGSDADCRQLAASIVPMLRQRLSYLTKASAA